jgi:hypothetical protein
MPIDLLDQPRGDILERLVYYLYKNGGIYSRDSIIEKMTGSKDGEEYLERNVIGILEAADVLYTDGDGKLKLKDLHVIKRCPSIDSTTFGLYFKIELLSKINLSKNPNIVYFSDFLRKIFDNSMIANEEVEEILREVRRNRGIPVAEGEELAGKRDYCITFLKYLNLIQQIGRNYMICIPRDLLKTVISIALQDINKTNIKLYSELFEYIDKNYIPVLDRREGRLLTAFYNAMNKEEIITSFNFAHVPDGGRDIQLRNRWFNAIIMG